MKIEADMLLNIIYYTIVDDYTLALHACHHHLTRKSRCTAAPTTGVFCSSSFSSALRALLIFRSPGLIHELVVGASAMENVYKYFVQNQCLEILKKVDMPQKLNMKLKNLSKIADALT